MAIVPKPIRLVSAKKTTTNNIIFIRSCAVPKLSGTWLITPCVNAEHGSVPNETSMIHESPNPCIKTPSITMISLFLNLSGLANHFKFLIYPISPVHNWYIYLKYLTTKRVPSHSFFSLNRSSTITYPLSCLIIDSASDNPIPTLSAAKSCPL